jgi:CheY-like chemotaxis protein
MRRTKTFLLLEDDDNDAFLAEMQFKGKPEMKLCRVRDGEEAIWFLQGKTPYEDRKKFPMPDVILLDLKMPKVNGFEFLQWLHFESPGELRLIPVIVMSGSSLQEDVKRAYTLGANLYLTKPVDWRKFNNQMALLGLLVTEHAETPIVATP